MDLSTARFGMENLLQSKSFNLGIMAVDFESFEITRDFHPGNPQIFSRATRADIRASRIG